MYKKSIVVSLFFLLSIFVIACSSMISNNPSDNKITGEILEVNDNSILIIDENDDKYLVTINEDTSFKEGIEKDFFTGNMVTLVHTGEIMESYPMQITAKEIISNEVMIKLDPRESISGILGEFPADILTKEKTTGKFNPNIPFAIQLEENASTGYKWTYETSSDNIVLFADKAVDTNTELIGAPSYHYWGFKGLEVGEYTITFKLISPTEEDVEVVEFEIEIVE